MQAQVTPNTKTTQTTWPSLPTKDSQKEEGIQPWAQEKETSKGVSWRKKKKEKTEKYRANEGTRYKHKKQSGNRQTISEKTNSE